LIPVGHLSPAKLVPDNNGQILRPLFSGSYAKHTFDEETVSMGIIGYLVSLLIVGFVVGGLGRLVVPGPNPIGAGRTLGVGLIGAFVGGLIGGLLGLGVFAIIFEVAISAGLVYLVSGRSRRLHSSGQHQR
jgi:uncharacterized membrane protein YeaQ/YmgE (transglycosylase-associated protein family)